MSVPFCGINKHDDGLTQADFGREATVDYEKNKSCARWSVPLRDLNGNDPKTPIALITLREKVEKSYVCSFPSTLENKNTAIIGTV